jgi:hypothetical protein
MTAVVSLIAVFLAGALFGALLVFAVSIHRTSRAPLSQSHGKRAGSVSRRVLAGIRTDETETGK